MLIVRKIELIVLLLIVYISVASSANYYCDPSVGNINNKGSIEQPWGSLSEVFEESKTFSFGDTIYLYGGLHGDVNISGKNTDYVVVASLSGNTPHLSSLVLKDASFWKFIGIDISRKAPEASYNVYSVSDEYFLVQTDKKSSNIFFDACNIYTEGVDLENWDRNNWFEGTLSGMMLRSKYNKVENCLIKNTNFSIEVHGRYTELRHSTIENFVGDAIRALSSYSVYEYNTVMNSYDITGYDDNSSGQNSDYPVGKGNHDDLFQSYTSSVGGTEFTVSDVVVRYNKFYSYTSVNQIDKSYTQGVALFDGFFNDWVIENNLIVTDSWHGITMLGVNNALITNNTLLVNPIHNDLVLADGSAVNEMTPFIWIGKTKSGEKSYDNTVRNNLIIQSKFGASGYKNIIDEGENTILQNNHTIAISAENNYFVDYVNFDFNTTANSLAIDAGVNINLAMYDLGFVGRLLGENVDCGAYEFDNSAEGNNCPTIQEVNNQEVKQFNTLELKIKATDIDDSSIVLECAELEDFMEFVDNGDGTAWLTVSPLKEHLGEYQLAITATDDSGNSSLRSFLIEVNYGTTIADSKNESEINIYPNPIKRGNAFQLIVPHMDLSNSKNVEIYNVSGVKVLSIKAQVNGNALTVHTKQIKQSGIYLLSYKGYRKTISIQ